jgi:protein-disulfide isomerase/uncharacterized membrane protein
MKKTNWLTIALLSTVLAIGLHIYLTQQHVTLKLGVSSGNSLCNISSKFNCEAVAASKYASIMDIPLALLGAITNGLLLFLISIRLLNFADEPERMARYGFYLNGFIALTSVVMGLISASFLSTFCLFCIGTYILSFIGFISMKNGLMTSPTKHIGEDFHMLLGDAKWVLVLFIGIPGFAFVGNKMVSDSYGLSELKPILNASLVDWMTASNQTFDLTKGLSFQKETNNPVMTIVEFADFRCSHCKHAYPSLHAFAESHPGVRVIFKAFPLDGTCNSALTNGDGVSCKLANFVFCAEKVSQKGWAMHNFLFDHQEEVHRIGGDKIALDNKISEALQSQNINEAPVKACMESPESMALIRQMAEEGKNSKIEGTPTIFVNNRKLDRGQILPVLQAVYEQIKNN